jgi:hypothetical protein
MKKNDILNNIINIANKILEDSETCNCCGKQNDNNAFLCDNCTKWYCSSCESELIGICDPCFIRDQILIINQLKL